MESIAKRTAVQCVQKTPAAERATHRPRRWRAGIRPESAASGHWVAVRGAVAAGEVVLQLTFDVAEQRAGAKAEQLRAQVLRAQLLLHHQQPVQRLLGRLDAARGLEAHLLPRALVVLADGAHHR